METETGNLHPICFSPDMVRAILRLRKTSTRIPIKKAYPIGIADAFQIPQKLGDPVRFDHSVYRFPAVHDGEKWQFRQRFTTWRAGVTSWIDSVVIDKAVIACHNYGKNGGTLWVQESHRKIDTVTTYYYAYASEESGPYDYTVPFLMPYEAARIWLRVRDIHPSPLQCVDDLDAFEEGYRDRNHFKRVWDSIHGCNSPFSWDNNPMVWVVKFRVLDVKKPKIFEKEEHENYKSN